MKARPRFARRLTALATGACLVVLAAAGPCRAELITIAGTTETSGPGYFTGTLDVKNVSTTEAVITLTLKNTSPLANGGFITGFAFNDPNAESKGDITNVTGFTQSYDPLGQPPENQMQLIGGASYTNTISGSPYGSFDIGAAVGGDLLGGGAPQPGVEIDQIATFTFTVTGLGLNNLTAAGLMSTLSTGGQSGAAALLVRFRGFTDGDSDKVVAGIISAPPPPPPVPPGVPAPPSVVLAGFALCSGLFGRAIRRRTAAAV